MNTKKRALVILDNGHGESTPGKRSQVWDNGQQLLEWKYTREIAAEVQKRLNQLPNFECVRIAEGPEDIGLTKRASQANNIYKLKGGPALLVSIHCNAGAKPGAHGWEVFSTEGLTNSDKAAQAFLDIFPKVCPDKKLRGHKEKNWTIIYAAKCPAVLTENFFMDTEDECKWMLSEEGKEAIVKLHVDAIVKYFTDNKLI